jgi:hypothetical protein
MLASAVLSPSGPMSFTSRPRKSSSQRSGVSRPPGLRRMVRVNCCVLVSEEDIENARRTDLSLGLLRRC